jgi:hypothetical protein
MIRLLLVLAFLIFSAVSYGDDKASEVVPTLDVNEIQKFWVRNLNIGKVHHWMHASQYKNYVNPWITEEVRPAFVPQSVRLVMNTIIRNTEIIGIENRRNLELKRSYLDDLSLHPENEFGPVYELEYPDKNKKMFELLTQNPKSQKDRWFIIYDSVTSSCTTAPISIRSPDKFIYDYKDLLGDGSLEFVVISGVETNYSGGQITRFYSIFPDFSFKELFGYVSSSYDGSSSQQTEIVKCDHGAITLTEKRTADVNSVGQVTDEKNFVINLKDYKPISNTDLPL